MSHAQHAPEVHAVSDDHAGHGSHGIAKYMYVFAALCALTTVSFFTTTNWWQSHFDHKVSWSLMMAVSCTKALLVILFFMHVKYEANWKYVLTIPAAMMSIFLILMLVPDVGNRNRTMADEYKVRQAVPDSHDSGGASQETPKH